MSITQFVLVLWLGVLAGDYKVYRACESGDVFPLFFKFEYTCEREKVDDIHDTGDVVLLDGFLYRAVHDTPGIEGE